MAATVDNAAVLAGTLAGGRLAVIKIDSEGSILWSQIFYEHLIDKHWLVEIETASNGDIMVVGTSPGINAIVIRMDHAGQLSDTCVPYLETVEFEFTDYTVEFRNITEEITVTP
mmetsp:Transcript_12635/g.6268  ORF Transcript_12635/g.6268 Transcript_12635/m.6268 type:complete len:114 (+) Transcript_12635:346-687(+)